MTHPIVRVRWRDAYVETDEFTRDEIEVISPHVVVTTIGYLVRKTRDAIYVAQDYLEKDEHRLPSWRGITIIPRGMVIKQTVLRRGGDG